MIYVSALMYNPRFPPVCMSANIYSGDCVEELDVFADVLQLKPWQRAPYVQGKSVPHYVIEAYRRTNALSLGAKAITKEDYARLYAYYVPAKVKITRQYLVRKYRIKGGLKTMIYSRKFTPAELEWLEKELTNNVFKDIKKTLDKLANKGYNINKQGQLSL